VILNSFIEAELRYLSKPAKAWLANQFCILRGLAEMTDGDSKASAAVRHRARTQMRVIDELTVKFGIKEVSGRGENGDVA